MLILDGPNFQAWPGSILLPTVVFRATYPCWVKIMPFTRGIMLLEFSPLPQNDFSLRSFLDKIWYEWLALLFKLIKQTNKLAFFVYLFCFDTVLASNKTLKISSQIRKPSSKGVYVAKEGGACCSKDYCCIDLVATALNWLYIHKSEMICFYHWSWILRILIERVLK